MNAHAEKINIIQWIAGLKDKAVLQQLKKLMEQSTTNKQDWWNTISAEERKSIEKGAEDSKNRRITPHSEVRKKYEKWL